MAESIIKGGYEIFNVSAANNVYAYRRCGIVTVRVEGATITNTSQRTALGTLPQGWRPNNTVYAASIDGNTGYIDVLDDGTVQGFRTTAGTVRSTITYVATK